MHFDTPRHGWLPHPGYGRANSGRLGLHETSDGGRTWSERQVPPPGAGREARWAGYGAPRFHSSVLPVWLSEGDRSRVAFSVSEDQGRTWSFAAAVDFPKGERPPQASVAGKRVWWATDGDGSRVAVTTDGGKRWRHVPASGVRGRLASLEGLDERRAWAVEVSSEGVRLVETGDGGATWRPLVGG